MTLPIISYVLNFLHDAPISRAYGMLALELCMGREAMAELFQCLNFWPEEINK